MVVLVPYANTVSTSSSTITPPLVKENSLSTAVLIAMLLDNKSATAFCVASSLIRISRLEPSPLVAVTWYTEPQLCTPTPNCVNLSSCKSGSSEVLSFMYCLYAVLNAWYNSLSCIVSDVLSSSTGPLPSSFILNLSVVRPACTLASRVLEYPLTTSIRLLSGYICNSFCSLNPLL